MDEEKRKKYLEKKGVICPYCESDHISANRYEIGIDNENVFVVCSCESCDKKWKDVYEMVDVVDYGD